jgi:pyrroline-5-carboxylate reductase
MPTDFSKKRVAVLGAGKMGGILLKALLEKQLFSSKTTVATVQHEEKARTLSKKLGIPVSTDNRGAVRNADIILICVKESSPQPSILRSPALSSASWVEPWSSTRN